MLWFIVSMIFLLIAVGIFLFSPPKKVSPGGNVTPSAKPVAIIPFGLALLFFALSVCTVVGARNIGVEKFMSSTTGREMEAGFHLKAPWNNVADVDATIQPEEYDTGNPISVKIGDGGTAQVAFSYRWRINPDKAAEVYKDYDKAEGDLIDTVRGALVSTPIKAALNEAMASYNPLDGVQIDQDMTPTEIAQTTIPPIPYAELNEGIKTALEKKIETLGGYIEIQDVTISFIALPERTQTKIDEFNAKIQESKNTIIDIAIKEAQSRANNNLAKSVDESPNVLVSKCLDGLLDGSIENQPGFSCWPGAGGGVVIPSAK